MLSAKGFGEHHVTSGTWKVHTSSPTHLSTFSAQLPAASWRLFEMTQWVNILGTEWKQIDGTYEAENNPRNIQQVFLCFPTSKPASLLRHQTPALLADFCLGDKDNSPCWHRPFPPVIVSKQSSRDPFLITGSQVDSLWMLHIEPRGPSDLSFQSLCIQQAASPLTLQNVSGSLYLWLYGPVSLNGIQVSFKSVLTNIDCFFVCLVVCVNKCRNTKLVTQCF